MKPKMQLGQKCVDYDWCGADYGSNEACREVAVELVEGWWVCARHAGMRRDMFAKAAESAMARRKAAALDRKRRNRKKTVSAKARILKVGAIVNGIPFGWHFAFDGSTAGAAVNLGCSRKKIVYAGYTVAELKKIAAQTRKEF